MSFPILGSMIGNIHLFLFSTVYDRLHKQLPSQHFIPLLVLINNLQSTKSKSVSCWTNIETFSESSSSSPSLTQHKQMKNLFSQCLTRRKEKNLCDRSVWSTSAPEKKIFVFCPLSTHKLSK